MNDTVNIANGGRRLRPAIDELEGSLIRKVAESNIGRDDVIPLWFGEPDLPTPDYIKQAVVQALEDDHVFYAAFRPCARQSPPIRAS